MKTHPLTPQEQETVDYYNRHGNVWVDQHAQPSKISFWQDEVETLALLRPTGKLLEIGVGAGLEAQLLCQKSYDYVGIDISPTLLAIARQRIPSAALIEASLYNIPFQPDEFDLFWAAAVFLHVPKKRISEALSSLAKVLKKDAFGFVALKAGDGEEVDQETKRFFSYFTMEEFTEILNEHNFAIEKCYKRTSIKGIKKQTWLVFFVRYKQ